MSDLHDRLERLRQAGRLKRPTPSPTAVLPPTVPPASPRAPTPIPARYPSGLSRSAEASGRSPSGRSLPAHNLTDLLELPGMELVQKPQGTYLLRTLRFDLEHQQGHETLGAVLNLPAGTTAIAGKDPRLDDFDFRQVVFIDTETSGLAGGAGTIVFLTGVGQFEGDQYVVRQYFARTPAEEPAYLTQLAEHLAQAQGYVSFNGKAFDLPLLSSRFILAGLRPPNLQRPHLDLLHPARRLWRSRLGACNFTHLESEVLGHQRSGEDVPSWLIPSLWFRYAGGENNVDDMAHVLYHNLEDIVSMAPLAHRVCGTFGGVLDPHPQELLAIAQTHTNQGRLTEAETTYRRSLAASLPVLQHGEALAGLAAVLKHQDRLDEAAVCWARLAALELSHQVESHIELAKYHEWQTGDLQTALFWTTAALDQALTWSPGYQRTRTLSELRHRQERLQRKVGSSQ